MNAQLPSTLQHLAPIITQYGYFAVFGLLFVEDFGIPAPGETILITAAVFAGLGKLNIIAVVVVGIAAAFAGDNIGYAIGRYGGIRLIHRYGKYVFITPEKLKKTQQYFERNGVKVVIIARFVEGLRQLNGILAGVSSMKWKTFAPFNALGATIWVTTWSLIGYFGGSKIDVIEKYGSILAAVAGIAIIIVIIYKILRSKKKK